MKKTYIIKDPKGTRRVRENDFPLIIGSSSNADIPIVDIKPGEEIAYIGIAQGRAFVQTGPSDVPVFYNRQKLEDPARLLHGDTLNIGPTEILYQVEADGPVFEVHRSEENAPTFLPEKENNENDVLEIEPAHFRPVDRKNHGFLFARYRWLLYTAGVLALLLLLTTAWFVFTAKRVILQIHPEPDRVNVIGGFITPRWTDFYLMRPGEYLVRAVKDCYRPLEHRFEVKNETSQSLRLDMEKLPGRLSVATNRLNASSMRVDGAKVFIDGIEIGATPLTDMGVAPGKRHLEIRAKDYQALETDVLIDGCREHQILQLGLVPGWSNVWVRSIPKNANLSVDGNPVGQTPLKIQLFAGIHELKISAAGFKTWAKSVTIQANEPYTIEEIRLDPADGTLLLKTHPAEANVMVGDRYIGQTPLETVLPYDTRHMLRISKPGYETVTRKTEVASGERKEMVVYLKPNEGIINFIVAPPDAVLFVDGKKFGSIPQRLKLNATEHYLQLKKEGYHPFSTKITPQPGFPQEVSATLKQKGVQSSGSATKIQAKNGYPLKLVRPGAFTMGASRREQGRRPNETLRNIILKRPFYMGIREVTNKEFQEFLASHSSRAYHGRRLDDEELPVVQVTWEQAAMFCNWLSARESLAPVYARKGEALLTADLSTNGYRLPMEAEWEYCARFKKNGDLLKYPWGKRFPPAVGSGNYADRSAKGVLSSYLKDYDDGYAVTAPPARFSPNDFGLFDMGGNVAEWCHDFYTIYSSRNEKTVDPSGPGEGKHHVVRGSSWKDASISALRFSYRDYSDSKRENIGFRVCRYLE